MSKNARLPFKSLFVAALSFLLEKFGSTNIVLIRAPVEADSAIIALTRHFRKLGKNVLVCGNDSDFIFSGNLIYVTALWLTKQGDVGGKVLDLSELFDGY